MKIGNLLIEGFAALAPMAGVADRAMREMCMDFGAAFCVGELTSAKGLTLSDRKSSELVSVFEKERPKGVQLFGDDPEIMARAVEKVLKNDPDFIDINMGCPAPKVAASGGGSALMKNESLAASIVESVKKVSPVPVTVKMRSGWDENSLNAVSLAKACEFSGADAITVHGRTRVQMYAPPVNLDIIKRVKEAVKIPVIANGDITSFEDAKKMYDYTGCDFIMIGRAAMGAPWIFSVINAAFEGQKIPKEPTVEEKMKLMIKEVELMKLYKSERVAFLEARKHAAWYMRGLLKAADLRKMCCEINTMDDVKRVAEQAIIFNP